MRYRFGIEDIEPGHWVAWALDYPGCFSSGSTQQDAIEGAEAAVAAYMRWRLEYGRPLQIQDDSIEIEVVEVFHSRHAEGDYIVNAFFVDDARPLSQADVEEARWLLTCTRKDLLNALAPARATWRDGTEPSDEHGSLSDIMRHIAAAERWYLAMLGFEQPPLPTPTFAALEQTRNFTFAHLDLMAGDEVIRESSGERWSARKVVRRTLWHERDHTRQIRALLGD